MSIADELTQLSNIRTAIRQKLVSKGITDAGAHDYADFADDIENISAGVTPTGTISITENGTHDVTDYAEANVNVAGTLTVLFRAAGGTFFDGTCAGIDTAIGDYGGIASTGQTFSNSRGYRVVVLKNTTRTSMAGVFQAASYEDNVLETIYLNISTSSAASFNSTFLNRRVLKEIIGVLDFSSSTNNNQCFTYCYALESLTFQKNSIKAGVNISWSSKLTDESLISLANGLNSESTSTIYLHADSKTKCGLILGNNVDGEFVEGEGAMTLRDFITTVKGWTVA